MPYWNKIYAIFWDCGRACFLGKNSKHRNIYKTHSCRYKKILPILSEFRCTYHSPFIGRTGHPMVALVLLPDISRFSYLNHVIISHMIILSRNQLQLGFPAIDWPFLAMIHDPWKYVFCGRTFTDLRFLSLVGIGWTQTWFLDYWKSSNFEKNFLQACLTSKIMPTHKKSARLRILGASYIEKNLETKVWEKYP